MTGGGRPRILALFAQPLVYGDGSPVVQLDLEQERSDLLSWLEAAAAEIDFEIGSLDQLQRSLGPSVNILHFSGHGNDDGLLLEDQWGRAQHLRRDHLADILKSYNDGALKLAFLSACESQRACEELLAAGIPVVVGILRQEAIADEAARQFARAFYLGLAQGRAVGRAFEAAKAGVRAGFGEEADKFVLLHASDADPEIKLFQPNTEEQKLRLVAKTESPTYGVPQTGAFFGRALDLASLIFQLDPHRFVSVIGTGGIGKSSLVAAAARWFSRHRRFRDGIFWISLSDVQRIEILLSGVPALLDKEPFENITQLGRLLRDMDALLVLDNFESALGSADARQSARGFLNALLNSTTRLRILTTTRELVGGIEQGEGTLEVGRLGDEDAIGLLAHHSSQERKIFAEMRPDLATGKLIPSDALRELIEELHGYPLAITIIAPQLRDLTVDGLFERIRELGANVFEDPTIQDPIERTRMRSLAVSIGLSVRRLIDEKAEPALKLFGVLSLFPAGFTRPMLGELGLDRWQESMDRLRKYSLAEHDSLDDRFYLLAPMRRLAAQYLDAEMQRVVIPRAALVFSSIAEGLASQWTSLGGGMTARLLAREEANLREAINLCREVEAVSSGEITPSMSIAGHVITLYEVTHRLTAAERLERAISADPYWRRDCAGLGRVKLASGRVQVRFDHLDAGDVLYKEAERLYRSIDESLGLANTLKARGDLARRRAQLDVADRHYQEAERLFRSMDDSLGLANTLKARGDLAQRRDQLDAADGHYQEAERLFRSIDESLGLANTLNARGDLARRRDQLDAADRHYQEAERLYRSIDASLGLANTLRARGDLEQRRDQLDAADGHYQEAERLFRSMDQSLGLANTVQARGDLQKRRGLLDEAMNHYAEARSIYERIDDSLGLSNVLVEMAEVNVEKEMETEALELLKKCVEIALKCENRYALTKGLELLRKLGIDLEGAS